MKKLQKQCILGEAWPIADLIVEYIKLQPGVVMAAIAGSIRRGMEVVQGIDIVAATAAPEELSAALAAMRGVEQVVKRQERKCTLLLTNGLSCYVYLVSPVEYPAALLCYTGSAGYVTKLIELAAADGLELSPAGLRKNGKEVLVQDEAELYKLLGLAYVEPELREDSASLLPAASPVKPLVTLADIRGIFHVHTTYSDGAGSLADMAAGARQRGWQYLGIADHSKTAVYARGLRLETVKAQRREIEQLNAADSSLRILAGIESDILPDGSLDYPDEVLAGFDFVVASVHSSFRQSEADMTRRIIRAVENRYVTMLGHPTGRLLLRRTGYAVKLPEVIKAAAQSGTMIEINASPYRLDLDWRYCQSAREQGIMLAINPDAHAVSEFEHMRYGLAAARKAGLTADDIINSRSYPEVLALLKRKR